MSVNTYLTEAERTRLESVRVGIAGAGGLGSNCAMHLVRAGVRRFVIADFDVVSQSNLNRQFYFKRQIGRKKVDALAENLLAIEEGLELDMRDLRIDAGNAAGVFSRCDVIVEAFDAAEAKAMLVGALAGGPAPVVAASGIAGRGKSNGIRLRRIGKSLYLAGDCESAAGASLPPESPRVGIASAMQANTVLALLLGCEP